MSTHAWPKSAMMSHAYSAGDVHDRSFMVVSTIGLARTMLISMDHRFDGSNDY
jgi:hypothetical protein